MSEPQKQNLIIDANNILYGTFFGHIDEDEEVVIGMCHHAALMSMNKYYRQFPADDIVMAFDSYSWRKVYTADLSNCVTHKKYKAQRRENLTPRQLEKLANFDQHVEEFADLIRNHTSILTLQAKYLEADDLIAGFIQGRPDEKHVLISSDKDFKQLLVKHQLTLIDPQSGKPRDLEDYDNDPGLFMFEKNFRGDSGDNVISAYPRIRATKIKQAYTDPFLLENLMNHEFTVLVNDADGGVSEKKYVTRDVFEENEYLMDLTKQPDAIRKLMDEAIERAIETRGKYNHPKFLRFCGKHELKNILQSIDNFVPMLSARRRTLKAA